MQNTCFVNVSAVYDWHIPDDLWESIALLLPEHKNTHRFGGGRPRKSDRKCMEAILFVLRTGCQWKALNATRFCPSSTAHDRFQEWVAAGVFQKMWEAGLMAYDDWKGIDWSWQSMDGCMTKAPLGGKKDGQKPDRSCQERGQTQSVGGCRWDPIGIGSGRRQPPRRQDGRRDPQQHSCRTPCTHEGESSRPVPGQGLCR
jgi:putative transposase